MFIPKETARSVSKLLTPDVEIAFIELLEAFSKDFTRQLINTNSSSGESLEILQGRVRMCETLKNYRQIIKDSLDRR